MKNEKLTRSPWALITLVFAFLILGLVSARAADAGAPSTGNPTADSILTWLTPLIVPVVLLGVKKITPSIPSGLIPILAPVIGVIIDLVNHFALGHASNLLVAAGAGLIGVGLREVKEAIVPAVNGGWPTPPTS